ncbi:class I SAM-dependent methyltransferase [Actinoplanes sp. Pm04-4]|uniref:Class I SAM-dependent methyltransferase n=1 Tax=Paractinoplanes pyxinae TaxID=2997416 RepID=A0ABT4AR60_9ACTN|nr:class I SAM-dependent methyltransferase [Actinoplanes pyxinae]MCY1136721.1 class I SAM-dependent methyltransferase [Actinoplanes pyxinae]
MTAAALAVFDAALERAVAGAPGTLTVRHRSGAEHAVDTAAWCRGRLPGDLGLLDRCQGPTLDVGCGPGRLTYALNRRGHPALGIDISAAAVRLARARGATVLRRDVFGPLPGEGRWRHVLLADGNIGIGGDPVRLLRRCRELLAPDGLVHVELAPPDTPSWSGAARITAVGGAAGEPFRWAVLAAGDLPATAAAAGGLPVVRTWTEAGRWFATLGG